MSVAEQYLAENTLTASFHAGGSYSDELTALRRRVYVDELHLLHANALFDANDDAGEHLLIHDNGVLVAAMSLPATQDTDFSSHTGIANERLAHTFCLSGAAIHPDHRNRGLHPLMTFLAMRRHRMQGRTHYVAFAPPGDTTRARTLGHRAIRGVPPRVMTGNNGHTRTLVAVQGRIDEAMIRCFDAMPEEMRALARGDGFVEEIRAAVMARVETFVANPFFESARQGTLGFDQYVHSTANNHQFVRYTTRILGLAVGACEDPELRKHFAHHLEGEVNHEVWLEQDLDYLGIDVDYVTTDMVADAPIMNFCFIQESMTAFRRDPVVFMAVPIAIEGASAFMPMPTIMAIRECIRGWGFDRPELGSRFLASHVHTDGGYGDQDGHWDGTLQMMVHFVRTERQQQQILRIIGLVFDALDAAYTGYAATPNLDRT